MATSNSTAIYTSLTDATCAGQEIRLASPARWRRDRCRRKAARGFSEISKQLPPPGAIVEGQIHRIIILKADIAPLGKPSGVFAVILTSLGMAAGNLRAN